MKEIIVFLKDSVIDEDPVKTFRAGENERLSVLVDVSVLVVERRSGTLNESVERWGFNIDNVKSWTER